MALDSTVWIPCCVNMWDVTIVQLVEVPMKPLSFLPCSNGELHVVEYLTKELKVNSNATDNNGETPLHYACR